jgi:hypothetical protein
VRLRPLRAVSAGVLELGCLGTVCKSCGLKSGDEAQDFGAGILDMADISRSKLGAGI